MVALLTTVTVLAVLKTCAAYGEMATPVYGFQGAATTLQGGKSLHYLVDLTKCSQTAGPDPPELADAFGGGVNFFRNFNSRDISPIPYMEFYEQRLTYNSTGHMVQLSRAVRLWQNDTAEVTTTVYTPDFGDLTYMTAHECTMATADKPGAVDLFGGGANDRILSFDALVEAFQHGHFVHFQAMVFLCAGGKESTFSTVGGRLTNFEMMKEGTVRYLETSVQHTVHLLADGVSHVMDILNTRVYENRTVAITDARGTPPRLTPLREHNSFCFMDTGVPGATVEFFSS